jgi:chromosomal replication initiation ATPase DnaA
MQILHDPYLKATPSQREAAAEHRKRQERIRAAAYAERVKEAAEIDDQQVAILERSWEERQRDIPIQKPMWFGVIAEIDPPPAPRAPLVEDIQRVACRYFEVKRNDLLSPRRAQRVAYPRQIAFYLAKTMTMKSFPDIGRRFGGRDHTTVLHGYRKIERLMKTDWLVAYDVAHVEMML